MFLSCFCIFVFLQCNNTVLRGLASRFFCLLAYSFSPSFLGKDLSPSYSLRALTICGCISTSGRGDRGCLSAASLCRVWCHARVSTQPFWRSLCLYHVVCIAGPPSAVLCSIQTKYKKLIVPYFSLPRWPRDRSGSRSFSLPRPS